MKRPQEERQRRQGGLSGEEGRDDVGTRRLAVVVVEAKKAGKLPVMMLHAEKHVERIRKHDSGDVACLQ